MNLLLVMGLWGGCEFAFAEEAPAPQGQAWDLKRVDEARGASLTLLELARDLLGNLRSPETNQKALKAITSVSLALDAIHLEALARLNLTSLKECRKALKVVAPVMQEALQIRWAIIGAEDGKDLLKRTAFRREGTEPGPEEVRTWKEEGLKKFEHAQAEHLRPVQLQLIQDPQWWLDVDREENLVTWVDLLMGRVLRVSFDGLATPGELGDEEMALALFADVLERDEMRAELGEQAAQPPDLVRAALGAHLARAKFIVRRLGLLHHADREGDQRGLRVREVLAGSPAEDAGFKIGDLLLSINGQATPGPKELKRLLLKKIAPGATLRFDVLRVGKPRFLEFVPDKGPMGQPTKVIS